MSYKHLRENILAASAVGQMRHQELLQRQSGSSSRCRRLLEQEVDRVVWETPAVAAKLAGKGNHPPASGPTFEFLDCLEMSLYRFA